MESTNVASFESFKIRRELRERTEIPDPLRSIYHAEQRIVDAADAVDDAKPTTVAIRDLYPTFDQSTQLGVVLDLLDGASKLLSEAISDLKAERLISADDAVQHFQAVLPELFCLRKIGDGYGAIINAIWFALRNQRGKPLSLNQIATIRLAIEKVHVAPFLTFDKAVNLTVMLEDAGLVVDPPEIGFLADATATDDESIR